MLGSLGLGGTLPVPGVPVEPAPPVLPPEPSPPPAPPWLGLITAARSWPPEPPSSRVLPAVGPSLPHAAPTTTSDTRNALEMTSLRDRVGIMPPGQCKTHSPTICRPLPTIVAPGRGFATPGGPLSLRNLRAFASAGRRDVTGTAPVSLDLSRPAASNATYWAVSAVARKEITCSTSRPPETYPR